MADLPFTTQDVSLFDNESDNYADINSDHELLVHDPKVYELLGVISTPRRWYSVNFLNSGSPSMLVNGSTTPVAFSIAPSGSEVWYVQSVCITILDSGAMDYNKFGTLSALTNGLTFEIKVNGVTTEVCNCQTNMELMGHFHDSPFTINSTAGFLSNSDTYIGQMIFDPPFVLYASAGDMLQFRVRDNLTSVDYLRIFAHYYKEV